MYNHRGTPPPAFPSAFPSADPYGSPAPGPDYHPGYGPPPGAPPSGYGPPSGPPPGSRGLAFPGSPSPGFPGQSSYGPPSGPPPQVDRSNYPGQQHHHQHNQYAPPPGPPGHYAPPAGPPGNYGAPSGPPPGHYAPPHGPPPMPPAARQNYGPQFQNDQHQMQQPFFQYSQCNGKKKALCIGINYFGQNGELRGCINDANNMQRFLCSQFGYRKEDIVMLTDDTQNPRQLPTRDNIFSAMQWLVSGANPNDSLFFHYSGHGGQTKDVDGDEGDGHDEVIYPLDFQDSGHIVDDMMHDIMVRSLPPGCRLTAIFDSCHSGTALDLPYVYSTEGKLKEPNLAAEAGSSLKTAFSSYTRGDMGGVFKSAMGLVKTATGGNKKAEEYTRATRTSPADVISFSGCKDSQTSADATEAGQATGAMSYALMTALSQNPQQSYQQLLNALRDILKAKYSQKPQLSSSHPMDTNIMFIC
ncbi:caspase domain-containing protein [Favolaschia claudopus]|uniref:Caspase domain-containing protein n=1 Tax=Favolaschia claudopus TaxID=2862362 RepID=A0AAW0C4Q2_9AGAR